MEFVNCAGEIYDETINFLTRLSARYARLVAEPIAKLAGEVEDHAEKANSIYPSDDQRRSLRKAHLPEGCFTTSTGRQVESGKAQEKLDKMAQRLGDLIDRENELLKGQIKKF